MNFKKLLYISFQSEVLNVFKVIFLKFMVIMEIINM